MLEEILRFINPWTILTATLGGLTVGISLFKLLKVGCSEMYGIVISTSIFMLIMALARAGMELSLPEADMVGAISHWVAIPLLYALFIISAYIGSKLHKPALFSK